MLETLKAFTALSEEFVELFMKHHPVAATEAGIHDYDHLLPNDSPDGMKERAAWLRDLEQRLVASVPWDELPLEARVDFALLRSRISALRCELEEIKAPQRTPSLFLMRAFRSVHLLLSRSFAPLDERKEAVVARLMAIPDYLEGAQANLVGVPPELLEAGIGLAARGPAFVDDVVRRLLRQFPGEAERLEHAGSRARSGFLRLHDHLEKERSTDRRISFALSERWINYKLDREHLLGTTAPQVEQLARDRMEISLRQMEDEARRAAPGRSWRELVAEGRERRPEAGWLREVYAAEIERAKRFALEHRLVPVPERDRLEVAETPLYTRDFSPQSSYQGPAPFDNDAQALFQFTPIDPRRDKEAQTQQLAGHCLPMLPIIALRETWPGLHVLHTHAANAGTRLRRMARSDAMMGGWAAYAEDLMSETGFLDSDPLAPLFSRLVSYRRAYAAMLDIALHCGRITPPEAEQQLVTETLLEPEDAAAVVRECCVAPTRAAAAFMGRLVLLDLRDEARRRAGDRFDHAKLHAAICAGGILPPALVGEELWERLGAS